ncbi:MAG: GNAT family N-acetyltransferase [Pseudomonadota bacterium]
MPITLKRVGKQDQALFDHVAPDVFDGPIHKERLARYVAIPQNLMVLALSDQQVIGQITGVEIHHPDEAPELYIGNLGVTPAFQRQGIARRLMHALLAWGLERGCAPAWVATETNNGPAQALYRSFARPQTMYVYDWNLQKK